MRFTLLAVMAVLISTVGASEGSGTNIYIGSNPTGFGYVEYLPVGYAANPQRPYPLIVFLHGSGETGDGTSGGSGLSLLHGTSTGLIYQLEHGLSLDAIVVAPQDDGSGLSVPRYDGFVKYCALTYRVDSGRICLTGLSAGGNKVWRILTANPTPSTAPWPVFASAVPIASSDYPYYDGAHFTYPYTGDTAVPHFDANAYKVWGFQNHGDPSVPWTRHARWYDSYAGTNNIANGWTSGTMSTYWTGSTWSWSSGVSSPSQIGWTVYPDSVHDAWSTAYTTSALWTWVLGQKTASACAQVIVDNSSATKTGTYVSSTFFSGYYSTDYTSFPPQVGDATATFTPTLPKTARYKVYAHFPDYTGDPGETMQADVWYGDGSTSSTVAYDETIHVTNQYWTYLGEWSMNSGTSCKVVTHTRGSSRYLAADAFMWEESPYLSTVIDNLDTWGVTTSGSGWQTLTVLSNYYGQDYLSSPPGDPVSHPERKAIYKMRLVRSGYYKFEIYYPTGTPSRGTATITVRKTGGSSLYTTTIDQRSGGATWTDLGTYYIATGGDEYEVETKHLANAAGYVSADAVRISEVAGIPPVDLYLDDTDALRFATAGSWASSTSLESGHESDPDYAFYGTDYLSAAPSTSNTATWTPNVAENTYALYLHWPCKAARGTITIDIVADGTNVLHTTQSEASLGNWVRLGGSTATYTLAPGSTYYIKITAPSSGGYVAADALRVVEASLVGDG